MRQGGGRSTVAVAAGEQHGVARWAELDYGLGWFVRVLGERTFLQLFAFEHGARVGAHGGTSFFELA
jgi:hypothetical protein